jgi:pyridoxamine 5'-phosphate oxidase family protein
MDLEQSVLEDLHVASLRSGGRQRKVGAPVRCAHDRRRIAAMSVFREAELRYLAGGRQLGRIATVGADGTPHVVPVAWIYNAARDTIEVGGSELERTKKFRDVARTGRAAIVIDDLASTDPWHPRGIEIRGRGEAIALPTPLIRIHPERIVSWGLGPGRSARTVAPRAVDSR